MSNQLKEAAVKKLRKYLEQKIEMYSDKMNQIQESIQKNEPKAGYDEDNSKGELLGDYERNAQWREEHEDQLMKLRNDIHPEEFIHAEPGAYVITDKAHFLVSVGVGELKLDEINRFYAISDESPIFKAMKDKKGNDTFSYNDTTYKIKSVH